MLTTVEVNSKGQSNVFGGVQYQRYARAQVGDATYGVDPGATIRRMLYAPIELRSPVTARPELVGFVPGVTVTVSSVLPPACRAEGDAVAVAAGGVGVGVEIVIVTVLVVAVRD